MSAQVSVIIVSYNVSELLRACLRSVFADFAAAEVVVVDNASSDDSVSMIQTEFPLVKLIANKTNAGFSAANNQGIEASTGEFIFLLNPDTELKAGAIQSMLNFAAQSGQSVLIGPQLLNSNGTVQVSAWKKPNPLDMITEAFFLHRIFGISEYPQSKFDGTFEAGMLSGAALFFPRSLYSKTGGLDPNLFWMEDADFSRRAMQAGTKVIYFPAAHVVHHSGQSSKKKLKRVISNQLLSKLKYYRKHFGYAVMAFTSLFCLIHIVSRMVLFGLAGIFSHSHAEKAGAYTFALGRFFSYLFTGDQRVT